MPIAWPGASDRQRVKILHPHQIPQKGAVTLSLEAPKRLAGDGRRAGARLHNTVLLDWSASATCDVPARHGEELRDHRACPPDMRGAVEDTSADRGPRDRSRVDRQHARRGTAAIRGSAPQ